MTVYNRNPGQVGEKERPAGDSLAERNPMALHKTMAGFTQSYGTLYTILPEALQFSNLYSILYRVSIRDLELNLSAGNSFANRNPTAGFTLFNPITLREHNPLAGESLADMNPMALHNSIKTRSLFLAGERNLMAWFYPIT